MLRIPIENHPTLLSVTINDVKTDTVMMNIINVQTDNMITIPLIEAHLSAPTRTFNFMLNNLSDRAYGRLNADEKRLIDEHGYLLKPEITLIHQLPGMYKYEIYDEIGILKLGTENNPICYDTKDESIIYKG